MLIIPTLNPKENLCLDAYSFQASEIETVAIVLRRTIKQFDLANLPEDEIGRRGARHIVHIGDVPRLEEHLGMQFVGSGPETAMKLTASPGSGFKCKEISVRGQATACVNLSAKDQPDAVVKCALLARQNGWFGGDASPGSCGKP